MKVAYIDDLIEKIVDCVDRHKLSVGCYSRWTFGEGLDLGRNEYGCADAANILYTVGRFPIDPDERAQWVHHLCDMQNPETGMYVEATHNTIHTTAHCTAALELFDAKPKYKPTVLEKYTTREGLYDFLENEVKWQVDPWAESHKGAGILPSLTNTDMVGLEWKDWYFEWMWEHTDPVTGFITYGDVSRFEPFRVMASGFHYMFNHETERRPHRYPEKVIDSCLEMMTGTEERFVRRCDFIDIDVVYTLTRSMRQTPYRFYEAKQVLEQYAERYLAMFYAIDYENDKFFNDLHMLFGAVCCLAELQSALPGKIRTTKPLRLVLDRRPFI